MTNVDLPPLSAEVAGVEVWGDVVGQTDALAMVRASVDDPVHAYLFVGPRGSGTRTLARAFAAALVSRDRDGEDAARQARMVLARTHADVTEFEPEGASLSKDEVVEILRVAQRTSVEGGVKVLILDGFDRVSGQAPKLLKTIEEPPDDTVFMVLADDIPEDLVTIASRCVRIDLGRVSDEIVIGRLVAEGVTADRAAEAAAAADGDLDRARLLATDERLALRRAAWRAVPDRLDGTGGRAVETADDLLQMIEDAMAPLVARQAVEVEEFEAGVKARGERGSGRKAFEDRHKREVRRYRTDALRAGLADLSRRYRDDVVATGSPAAVAAIDDIARTAGGLVRNPNERLQLVALFGRLGRRD